ncbi:MAG: Trehalose utilization [Smithella sp. PtaU1.Bin162]|nr:MAG: Trehalose utilization [Smithella sp. PtaU1.Bin162]
MEKIKVTVWNEFRHEKSNVTAKGFYPSGIHALIAERLNQEPDINAGIAALDDPEQGLSPEVLEQTDVLTWWGHAAHDEVEDKLVDRIQKRILEGMGLIVLHSGHYSKIFRRMMGTTCLLRWREAHEKERVWVTLPSHPIAAGVSPYFELANSEMYGEYFDIPQPDEQVFISWYEGGEVFRSGCCFNRGLGKIFYFSPGHEVYPIYHNQEVQKILVNAVRWVKFRGNGSVFPFLGAQIKIPLETIAEKNYHSAPIDHPN